MRVSYTPRKPSSITLTQPSPLKGEGFWPSLLKWQSNTMTTRITKTFANLKQEKRSGLIPFIMACDPDKSTSQKILESLASSGASLIELGIPFSDPMADGKTIQAAGRRALAAGASLKTILEMVKAFRKANSDTPLILMGYYNPIYRYGAEAFSKDAVAAGVDGVIIVDLPPEEEDEFQPHAEKAGLTFVRLIAPTTLDERLKTILKTARGFLYYVAVAGVTGAKSADPAILKARIAHLRQFTDLPIAVGFGIKNPDQVKEVGAFADAVVVGSSLVNEIANSAKPVEAATTMVKALRA